MAQHSFRVSQVMSHQRVQTGADPCPQQGAVTLILARFCSGSLWRLRPDAFAVDVHRKDIITKASEHLGPFFFVVAQSFPLMNDEHGRPLALHCIVVNRQPFQHSAALFVLHRLRDDFASDAYRRKKDENGEYSFLHDDV